jgi:hypothetical protein
MHLLLDGDGAAATLIIEIAGFADENQFGIYDATNPELMALVFDGSADAGDTATINISGGEVKVDGVSRTTGFGGGAFGFYITTPQEKTFFSEDDLNPGGKEQALLYQGEGATLLQLDDVLGGPFVERTFTRDMFIVAFGFNA